MLSSVATRLQATRRGAEPLRSISERFRFTPSDGIHQHHTHSLMKLTRRRYRKVVFIGLALAACLVITLPLLTHAEAVDTGLQKTAEQAFGGKVPTQTDLPTIAGLFIKISG